MFMVPFAVSVLVADKIRRRTLLNRKYSDCYVLLILVTNCRRKARGYDKTAISFV